MKKTVFEWDDSKDELNKNKHCVSFHEAQYAFFDPCCVIAEDMKHSQGEKRYYCIGKIAGGIITVRFTYRSNAIRIIGAGYWRKGKETYEKNKIHK